MDSPPLHPNDNDPASPHSPLINDDDLTKSSPDFISPPPPEKPLAPWPDFISTPPLEQSVSSSALQQKKKKRRHIFSRTEQKSSSNNNLDLKGHVMVRFRTTPADIIKLENNTRIIPEQETVCIFCFHLLFPVNNVHHNNNNNVMMVKCKCKQLSLAHELCASEWSGKEGNNNNKCDGCDEDVNYIPVTLSRPTDDSSSSTPKPDKGFTLKKLRCCYSTPAD